MLVLAFEQVDDEALWPIYQSGGQGAITNREWSAIDSRVRRFLAKYSTEELDWSLRVNEKNYRRPHKDRPSFVYLIHDPLKGLHKIGCTTNVERRLVALRSEYDRGLLLIGSFQTGDRYADENWLHDKYRAFALEAPRSHEWFDFEGRLPFEFRA